jgi:cyclophilin family peptidyl-prolyl cis-trans isomerase
MMKYLIALLLAVALPAIADDEVPAHPQVLLETTEGNILLELDGRRAPLTVAHFLKLVESGYYDGTIFHRVIPEFMIQGGGYNRDLKLQEAEGGIPNESGNGLPNLRGTIAMAREEAPHSAMAQFFINVADNKSLNPRSNRWGYAVFGYVIDGMSVVDKIVAMPTGPAGPFDQDVPVAPVIITKAKRL